MGTLYADSMAGSPVHGDPFSRIHIVKMDNDGNIIWDKKYGKSEHYNYLTNIRYANDGSIIACGTKPNTFPLWSGWLLKLNADSDRLWYRLYDNLHGDQSQNQLKDIIPTSDNGFVACGYVFPKQPDTGTQDAWVIKLDSLGCDTPGCNPGVGIQISSSPVPRPSSLHIFPNPAGDAIYFNYQLSNISYQLSIYDLYGRKQDEIIIPKGHEQVRVDVSGYPAGVYMAVLNDETGVVARGKFVKTR